MMDKYVLVTNSDAMMHPALSSAKDHQHVVPK